MNKIKKSQIALLIITIAFLASNASIAADKDDPAAQKIDPPYSKFLVSAEVLGAALSGSIFGSYRFLRLFAVNLGMGYTSINGTPTQVNLVQFPVSISNIWGGTSHFIEVLAGIDLLLANVNSRWQGYSVNTTGSTLMFQLGTGYRYWPSDGGIHFRATIYQFFHKNFTPHIGFGVGYAFAP